MCNLCGLRLELSCWVELGFVFFYENAYSTFGVNARGWVDAGSVSSFGSDDEGPKQQTIFHQANQ